jgi:hypothetical protein
MHGFGHWLPCLDLLGGPDAGGGGPARAFLSDAGCFGDNQACTCALRIIIGLQRADRYMHAFAAPTRERGHQYAVGGVDRAELRIGSKRLVVMVACFPYWRCLPFNMRIRVANCNGGLWRKANLSGKAPATCLCRADCRQCLHCFWAVAGALSDTGPIATGFWRLALAAPFLAFHRYRAGFRIRVDAQLGLLDWCCSQASFFAVDIIAWHIGIFKTKARQCDAARQLCQPAFGDLWHFPGTQIAPADAGRWPYMLAFAGSGIVDGAEFRNSPEHFEGDLAEPARWAVLHRLSAGDDPGARKHRKLVVAGAGDRGSAAIVPVPVAWFAGEKSMPGLDTFDHPRLVQPGFRAGLLTYALAAFQPAHDRAGLAVATRAFGAGRMGLPLTRR